MVLLMSSDLFKSWPHFIFGCRVQYLSSFSENFLWTINWYWYWSSISKNKHGNTGISRIFQYHYENILPFIFLFLRLHFCLIVIANFSRSHIFSQCILVTVTLFTLVFGKWFSYKSWLDTPIPRVTRICLTQIHLTRFPLAR